MMAVAFRAKPTDSITKSTNSAMKPTGIGIATDRAEAVKNTKRTAKDTKESLFPPKTQAKPDFVSIYVWRNHYDER
jgi:hypothetical protein